MVSSSKILTVSYGTFSCTLEGFDDSFDTMKAIAEYFRDLAADDRYFGAEPPTPDAEMLARIAEREISRRVDAHEDRGKIVLRAASSAALPTNEQPAEEPEVASENSIDETLDDTATTEEAIQEPEVAEESQDVTLADEAVDETPVAEQEVAQDEAPALAEPEQAAEPEVSEVAAPAAEFPAEETAEQTEDTVQAEVPENTDFEIPAEISTEMQPEQEADSDSIAAKLRRIRSVVSHPGQSYESENYSEDEHAQNFLKDTTTELDAVLAASDESEYSEQAPIDTTEFMVVETDDDIDMWEDDIEAASIEDEAPEQEVELAEDTLAQLLADSIPTDTTEIDDLSDYQEDSDLDDQEPLSARVIKMDRGNLNAAIEQGYIEEDTSADDGEDDSDLKMFEDGVLESTLSPEDEEDLQRELAEVEAGLDAEGDISEADTAEMSDGELSDDSSDDLDIVAENDLAEEEAATAQETPEPEDAEEPSARGLNKLDQVEAQSDLARIFDEADHHLEEPESHKRRNAIQHLRAAVAATRAEKNAGADLKKDVDDTPYRTDLAEAVRPRRPRATEGVRVARPEEARPAPLKLVAEQRVDAPRDPIRPRRVSSAELLEVTPEETEISTSSGFSEFAEELGVTRLPELLEAAAAYMSDVEGRPQFSRPMLMSKLKEVAQDDFSREDGLRSFGQLLRLGKIQKLKGGRFAVTDETEYRADDERHAG